MVHTRDLRHEPWRYRLRAFVSKPANLLLVFFLIVLVVLSLLPMATMLSNMVHRARRHGKETAAPAGRLHHALALPKAVRRGRMEPGQLLAAPLELADCRARFGHTGHCGRRHGRVVHHAFRPQMQKIHFGCFRLSLHDARMDARPVLDEHVPKQPGRRRQHRHGGIHLRRVHAGVVCLRPVPDDRRHGPALLPVRVSAHRRHSQKYGCDA